MIVAILEQARIGAPDAPTWDVEADAAFWAGLMTYEGLRGFFIASGRKLINQQLDQRGRMRLIKCILASMSVDKLGEVIRELSTDDWRKASTTGDQANQSTAEVIPLHQVDSSGFAQAKEQVDWPRHCFR